MVRQWDAAAIAISIAILLGTADATEGPAVHTPSPERFTALATFHGEAILDRTTQLIWERTPHATQVTWTTATTRCALKNVGGRTGWRLPSFLELMTLVEPPLQQTTTLAPALPIRHPFQGVTAGAYWTSDSSTTESAQAYVVDFLRADVASHAKHQVHPLWCVQGGIADPSQATPPMQTPGLI